MWLAPRRGLLDTSWHYRLFLCHNVSSFHYRPTISTIVVKSFLPLQSRLLCRPCSTRKPSFDGQFLWHLTASRSCHEHYPLSMYAGVACIPSFVCHEGRQQPIPCSSFACKCIRHTKACFGTINLSFPLSVDLASSLLLHLLNCLFEAPSYN